MALVRLIARPMLASMFIVGGINSLKNSPPLAQRAKPVTEKLQPMMAKATESMPFEIDDEMMVKINGGVHIAAGLMLASGKMPRLASAVLLASLIPTTFGGHRFWEESDPQLRANQKTHFFKNVSMAGGLILAAVDTAGKPSLAWRARAQARRARSTASRITPG